MSKFNLIKGLAGLIACMFAAPNLAQVNALTVDDQGFIGVNTDTPAARMHVLQNTGNAGEMLRFENNGGSHIRFLNTVTGRTWFFTHENNNVVPSGPRFIINSDAVAGPTMSLAPNGNMVIAGSLTTAGNVLPDYVFDDDYPLMSIEEIAKFVKENRHLPNVPSNAEVEKTGQINMTEMQLHLLEKVEELFLHTIEQETQINVLRQENNSLRDSLAELTEKVEQLDGSSSQ